MKQLESSQHMGKAKYTCAEFFQLVVNAVLYCVYDKSVINNKAKEETIYPTRFFLEIKKFGTCLEVTSHENEQSGLRLTMDLPFKHKGVMTAPFIGAITLEKWLKSGQIEQVVAGGENYDGNRVLKYEWVKSLYDECKANNVMFCFIETGTKFEKDGKIYTVPSKRLQSEQAYKSGLQFEGKPIKWQLHKPQSELFDDGWYVKHWRKNCETCGSRLICNGCSNCGECEK